jgi:polyferredoxin
MVRMATGSRLQLAALLGLAIWGVYVLAEATFWGWAAPWPGWTEVAPRVATAAVVSGLVAGAVRVGRWRRGRGAVAVGLVTMAGAADLLAYRSGWVEASILAGRAHVPLLLLILCGGYLLMQGLRAGREG